MLLTLATVTADGRPLADSGPVCFRIDAERLFPFQMTSG